MKILQPPCVNDNVAALIITISEAVFADRRCMTLRLAGCALLMLMRCSAQISTQTWDTESGLPQNTVQAIRQTRDGYLWFATEGGLARFDSQNIAVFNTKNTPEVHSNDVRDLLEDSGGTLWIATADGLVSLSQHLFHSFTTTNGLPSNLLTRLFIDKRQRVCVNSAGGAACLVNDRFIEVSNPTVNIPTRHFADVEKYVLSGVLCSYVDREGNTWIGTESSGVTVVRKLAFMAFSSHSAGLDDQVRCVFADHSGAVWFGTNSQGLTRYSQGQFERFTAADGLSSNVVVALGESTAGDLLIGTPDGLNIRQNGHFRVITSADGLPDDFVRSIHSTATGAIWIGTRRGLVRLQDNRFQTYTHSDGIGSDLIGSMTEDTAGHLWIATLGGLTMLNGDRFRNFTTADGLSSNIITALFAAKDGSLWIGTQGGGLNRYANGVISRVVRPGVPEVIYGIVADSYDRLWLTSDLGIVQLDSSEAISYGVSDGLRVSEVSGGGHPSVARTKEGVWFGTLKGAAFLRQGVVFNQAPPPVVVESVTVNQRTTSDAASVDIPPGFSHRLTFNYEALEFYAPQKVAFRYRLNGFDKTWVEAGNARTAFYTNIGPGQYQFQVIARTGNGIWNHQGATVRIRIQPHLYETWWFAALMLLPLTMIGYAGYRWRVSRVAAAMESRFEAVLGERNRIAREIHDTLAQGFAGISVQLELVSRKLGTSAESSREHLDQARMLVRSSLAEARRSIWELRSQSADIEDLASRLSKMAAQMGGSNQPKISVQVRGVYRPLSGKLEDELLRIAQEAVTNAIRHAQASKIDVELEFDARLLRMVIADDGRGFSPTGETSGVNGHFGLTGMRERAAGVNAKLKLDTAPGSGTKLSIEVPV